MYSSLRLAKLKCELLKTLNDKPVEDITDNEAELTLLLSQDKDVQEVLSRSSAVKSVETDLKRMRSEQMERSRRDSKLRVAMSKIYKDND